MLHELPDLEAAMAAAGVDFEAQVFDGCGHAFFNDTRPASFDPEVAAQAWGTTLAFLERAMGSEHAGTVGSTAKQQPVRGRRGR